MKVKWNVEMKYSPWKTSPSSGWIVEISRGLGIQLAFNADPKGEDRRVKGIYKDLHTGHLQLMEWGSLGQKPFPWGAGSLSENALFLGAWASRPLLVRAGGPRSQGEALSHPLSDKLLVFLLQVQVFTITFEHAFEHGSHRRLSSDKGGKAWWVQRGFHGQVTFPQKISC